MDERRRFQGATVGNSVTVSYESNGEFVEAFCQDLSLGGVQLMTSNEVAPGSELSLQVVIAKSVLLEVRAKAMWSKAEGQEFAVGVQFASLDAQAGRWLEQEVARLLQE